MMNNNSLLSLLISAVLLTLPFSVKANNTEDYGIRITPFTGYRYDVYQWSIPQGDSVKDAKASELTWRNHIWETGIKLETEKEDRKINFLGQAKYGIILNNSKTQDSDWDEIGEYSRSLSKVQGNSIDISGAIGYSQVFSKALLTYYVGMDYTKYNLKDYGLYNKIDRDPNTNNINHAYLGQRYPNSKLVTKYSFDNYAPWVGLSLNYQISDNLSIIPFIKAYGFYLNGESDWVLRDDVKHDPSFIDKATGYGASIDTEVLYKYSDNLDFRVNLGIKGLKMLKGNKKAFAVDGETDKTKLKDLTFISSSVSAGIKYRF
jgi:hypothetical protein